MTSDGNPQQPLPVSPIEQALRDAASDACEMLRQWSDSVVRGGPDETQLTPYKIGLFHQELVQHFAAVYFGTHERLKDIESGR